MATTKKKVKKKVVPAKTVKSSKTQRKTSPRKQKELKNGSRYQCSVCGLAVTVDEMCGCVDFCDIICCGEQMSAV